MTTRIIGKLDKTLEALALSGILSIVLGLALALMPIAGLLAVAWWFGAYSIAFGALLLALAIRLKSMVRQAPTFEHVTVR
jgi:uncharacterized membrane protein HdeD (DUF308 family)